MTEGGWPTGTVTFLFTDVEGSTPRWRADEAAMRETMRAHDEVLRSTVDEMGGVLFKHTGDGIIAAFASPSAGLAAAQQAQSRLALPVRMGLHSGEAELRDGDYFGTTLNRAARVMDAGHGGQILSSATTASLLESFETVVDLGLYELKGLDGAERVFQVGEGKFPPLRARGAATGNLPRDLTEFVGRADELEQVLTEIIDAPIVTLFGVGGTGKTRLALQVAQAAQPNFADGCWFIELGQITMTDAVPYAISTAAGFTAPDSGDVTDALVERLADRKMLLVIDNCEHVVDAVAIVIERVLAECPRVRIIATSREPLMVRGERVIPIGPLPDEDSLDLFLDRARAESPNLVLDEQQREAARALCARLDGLPLAIELAAARVRSMSPVDLLAGLDERFRLLVGSRRTRTERHQTMRATLDWSYSLCEPGEQDVFDRLSIFPASFDADAAIAVAGDDDTAAFTVRDHLTRLVDRSLVIGEIADDGTTRFRMLETMRVYGREHLRDRGHSDAVRERHARYLAHLIDHMTANLLGPNEFEVITHLHQLRADIVMAVEWLVDQGDFEEAMRLPSGLVLATTGEWAALMSLIRTEALRVGVSDALAAELDLSVLPVRFALTDDEMLARVHLISPLANRDITGGPVDRVDMSQELAQEIQRYADRFANARPLSRNIAGFFASRALIITGHIAEGQQLLLDHEQRTAELNSPICRSLVLTNQAQIALASGDWLGAAALFEEVVRLREGAIEIGMTTMLARFGSVAASARAGVPIPLTTLRHNWETALRGRVMLNRARAASATAMWLAMRGNRELAIRFLRWAIAGDNATGLPLYAADLKHFDLPVAPEPSNETIEQLVDELDLL